MFGPAGKSGNLQVISYSLLNPLSYPSITDNLFFNIWLSELNIQLTMNARRVSSQSASEN